MFGGTERIRNRLTIVTGLLFMFFCSAVVAHPLGFTNNTQLTNFVLGSRINPSIATDSFGNSHVVYYFNKIYYQKLDMNGSVLVSELPLTNTVGVSSFPVVAVDSSDNVFVVFQDNSIGSQNEIFLKKLNNTGAALTGDIRLSNGVLDSVLSSIAIDGSGSVHVVWSDQRDFVGSSFSQFNLYYSKVLNDGSINVSEVALTNNSYNTSERSRFSSIGVDSRDDVHVVFSKREASSSRIGYYMKLNNSGGIIVSPINVSFGPSGESGAPSLGLGSDDLVHVAFVGNEGGANTEVWYVRLFNNGSSTGASRRLTFDGAISGVVDDAGPSLGIDAVDNVHISWIDNRTGAFEIYYTELDNMGNTIIDDTRLSFSNVDAQEPSLALDGRGPVVAWHDYRNDPGNRAEIFYTRSIPFLNVTDFTVVYSNLSDRLFRFGVHNIAGQNLTGINWRLNTGEVLINSTLQTNLTINEKLMVFVWYSYINSGNYTVYATGLNQNVSVTNKLQVLV